MAINSVLSQGELGGVQPNIITFDIDGSRTFVEGPNGRTLGPLTTTEKYFDAIEQIGFMVHRFGDNQPIDGIGISIAASVEENRLIDTKTLGRKDWGDAPLLEDVASETGISADRIVLLNDRVAGAIAEQVARPNVGLGFFVNIGRGFSGGPYSNKKLRDDPAAPHVAPDNPGHYFLRSGAICPCGKHGCIEAFVSNYGVRQSTKIWPDNLPADDRAWKHLKIDLADGVTDTLNRYRDTYGQPVETMSVFGSIAMRGPDVFASLHGNLLPKLGKNTPEIVPARHGLKSAIIGARIATKQLLAQ